MANLDEIYSEIPTQEIADKLGVDATQVDGAVKTLVPVLVGSLHQRAQDGENAANIESAVNSHAASGLLDGGVSVDQVDQDQGNQELSRIFSGNDTSQVASALSGAGAGNSDLIKKLLPILTPGQRDRFASLMEHPRDRGGHGDSITEAPDPSGAGR